MALFGRAPALFSLFESPEHYSISKSSISKALVSVPTTATTTGRKSSAVSISSASSNLGYPRLSCCSCDDECSSTRIFIKGLPQSVGEGSLREAFSQFGEEDQEAHEELIALSSCIHFGQMGGLEIQDIFLMNSKVKIMRDKTSTQPLGFAYLWFTTQESAQLAVKAMDGKFFHGRFVFVTIAKPGPSKRQGRATPYKF